MLCQYITQSTCMEAPEVDLIAYLYTMCVSIHFTWRGLTNHISQQLLTIASSLGRPFGLNWLSSTWWKLFIVVGCLPGRESNTATWSNCDYRKRASVCVVVFAIIHCTGSLVAVIQAYKSTGKNSILHDIPAFSVIFPLHAFAWWEFAGNQIQDYCYGFMGCFYSPGSDHLRTLYGYKCVQLLGSKSWLLCLSYHLFFYYINLLLLIYFLIVTAYISFCLMKGSTEQSRTCDILKIYRYRANSNPMVEFGYMVWLNTLE